MSDSKLQRWETQRSPNMINAQKSPKTRNIIFKMEKIKTEKKILEDAGGKKHFT